MRIQSKQFIQRHTENRQFSTEMAQCDYKIQNKQQAENTNLTALSTALTSATPH